MQMETQPQLRPLLDLSSTQQQIIQAHSMQALIDIASIRFTTDKQLEGMMEQAFNQGKLELCKSLLSYDIDQFSQAVEQQQQGE